MARPGVRRPVQQWPAPPRGWRGSPKRDGATAANRRALRSAAMTWPRGKVPPAPSGNCPAAPSPASAPPPADARKDHPPAATPAPWESAPVPPPAPPAPPAPPVVTAETAEIADRARHRSPDLAETADRRSPRFWRPIGRDRCGVGRPALSEGPDQRAVILCADDARRIRRGATRNVWRRRHTSLGRPMVWRWFDRRSATRWFGGIAPP